MNTQIRNTNEYQGLYDIVSKNFEKSSDNNLLDNTDDTLLATFSAVAGVQGMFLELKKENTILIEGQKINFLDDEWDFTSLYKDGKNHNKYLYRFSSEISDYYKMIQKLYAIFGINKDGIHGTTTGRAIRETNHFFSYLMKCGVYELESIRVNDVREYMKQYQHLAYHTQLIKKRDIKNVLSFYSLFATNVYTQEFHSYFLDTDPARAKAAELNSKTKLLPTEFYKKLSEKLYESVFNKNIGLYERGAYGLLYIGTQTGLRRGELTILNVNCLTVMEDEGKRIGVLSYRSSKNGNKNQVYTHAKTRASEKVIEVYNELTELFSSARAKLGTEALVPNMRLLDDKFRGRKLVDTKYICANKIDVDLKKICIYNAKEWGLLNSQDEDSFECHLTVGETNNFLIDYTLKKEYPDIKDGVVLSLPTIKQFRVYFASEYHERGVSDKVISFLLNHKTSHMWGYYVRPKHKVQEDSDFSKEILTEIIKNDSNIIGAKGEAYKQKITNMIKDGNYNVATDLNEILDKAMEQFPIRAKLGGFCMKSNPNRLCRHDSETDEFMCAYGVCPNQCRLYYMAPITYKKCNELKQIVEFNKQEGYLREAEKEGYKLKYVIENELELDIKELESEIKKKGEDAIISMHPNLKDFVNNLENIKKEIKTWKKQLKQKS